MTFARSYVAIRSLLGMRTTQERGLRVSRGAIFEEEVIEVPDVDATFKFCDMYNNIISGTWAYVLYGTQPYGWHWTNTSLNEGDEVDYLVYGYPDLDEFELMGASKADGGKMEIRVDGELIGTIDMYTGGSVRGFKWKLDVVLPAVAIYTVNLKVIEKTLGSTNNYIRATWLRFV